MVPSVPDSYLQARQEQIIFAAIACFSRKGFHRTTMKEICDEAGLSPGAVYNYFKGKEDIVVRCSELSFERNSSLFEMADGESAHDALKRITNSLFVVLKTNKVRDIARFDIELRAESTRNDRVHQQLMKNDRLALDMLEDLVTAGQKEHLFDRRVEASAIARMLFSLLTGLEMQLAAHDEVDVEAYEEAITVFLDGLLVKKIKREK